LDVGDFAFATCLPGLEAALKREVSRTRPELKHSATRPGLVVFESARSIAPDDAPGSVLARVWGKSVGAASDLASARAQLAGLGAQHVHVFARDPDAATDLAPWRGLGDGGVAHAGELVANVVVADGEPVWLGMHRHDPTRPPCAGGTFAVRGKVDEAIAWTQLPLAKRALAIGIGFAHAGIDVTTVEKFSAVQVEPYEWIVVDAPLAPQVAAQELARIARRIKPAVAIVMFRVVDWSFADELPLLVEKLRAIGFADIRFRHLPSNRNDVCCVAR
jgi:23S rRNA (cytidine2498-2'-O)-methyltransferase